jgi:large subunit ribosomal protein L5e
MPFVKSIKGRSYFKRFQTKFRRRREARTDYYVRRKLIMQDKNKYDSKKYRFVVRKTNTKIICQVAYATPNGDRIMAEAKSTELVRYGLTAGLANYAASYATGLLCARRLLKSLKLDDLYKGVDEVDGNVFDVYEQDQVDDKKRPFKAILDIGITSTTTGNRCFGAMKGASDGGVYIKHNNKRFPGFKIKLPEEKGEKRTETFEADAHRAKIFGLNIEEYMDKLEEEDKAKYTKQFSKWDKCLKDTKLDSVEELYKKIHDEIRKNPDRLSVKKNANPVRKHLDETQTLFENSKGQKWKIDRKLTNAQRKQRVQEKIADAVAKTQAA